MWDVRCATRTDTQISFLRCTFSPCAKTPQLLPVRSLARCSLGRAARPATAFPQRCGSPKAARRSPHPLRAALPICARVPGADGARKARSAGRPPCRAPGRAPKTNAAGVATDCVSPVWMSEPVARRPRGQNYTTRTGDGQCRTEIDCIAARRATLAAEVRSRPCEIGVLRVAAWQAIRLA